MNFKAYLNFEIETANTVVEGIEIIEKDLEPYWLIITYTEIGKEPSVCRFRFFHRDLYAKKLLL